MGKLTFSLDDETVRLLRKLAARTKKPQSLVVREAVALYAAREPMLSDEERERKLKVLDDMRTRLSTKTADDVDRELREIRRARRSGGRVHPVD